MHKYVITYDFVLQYHCIIISISVSDYLSQAIQKHNIIKQQYGFMITLLLGYFAASVEDNIQTVYYRQ